jgi:ABC-2 type transport system ATP-binding protein
MRVDGFLNFVAEIKGITKSKRKKAVADVVEVCALDQVHRKIVGNLSKGYRKRVGLAQSLLGDSDVLILDEPTAGLDPEQVVEIRNLIKKFAGDKTILLSSHVLSEVSIIADRVIIIDKGEVLATGSPVELSDQLQQTAKVLAGIEGPPELIEDGLKKISGVLRVDREESMTETGFVFTIESQKTLDLEKEVTGLVFKNGWSLRRLQSLKLSLEEVFLKLVSRETGE